MNQRVIELIKFLQVSFILFYLFIWLKFCHNLLLLFNNIPYFSSHLSIELIDFLFSQLH